MARRALAAIERGIGVGDQAHDPRHLVGVDVEQAGGGIEGATAPLGAAVNARKDDETG